MGLVKRTYVDGETVITAENLNAIQDAIIENEEAIEDQGEAIEGKYAKPSGGIPSTDLASAVQTSLEKADTALQSSDIDSTLTVTGKAADAKKTGDEISDVRNTLNQLVRPNLLDNWYFGNPVNQRGQSSYSNTYPAYTIDRWFLNGNLTGGVTVNSGYITLYNFSYYVQKVEANTSGLVGKQVTLSILTDTDLYYGTVNFPGLTRDVVVATIPNIGYLKIYNENSKYFQAYLQSSDSSNVSCNVIAFKLELGTGQTLAHNEGTDANPVWVLNEIPDYSEQLYRCCASTADSSDTYANKPYAPQVVTVSNLKIVSDDPDRIRLLSCGKVCHFDIGGYLTEQVAVGGDLGIIPVGYRPKATTYFIGMDINRRMIRFMVNKWGNLALDEVSDGSASLPQDQWFWGSGTWIAET